MYKKIVIFKEKSTGVDLSILSEKELIKTMDNIIFVVPTIEAFYKVFKDSSPKRGIFDYHNLAQVNEDVIKIARKFKFDPKHILVPNESQVRIMLNDKEYKETLLKNNVWWIQYINDKENPYGNMSLTEFLENKGDGKCFIDMVNVISRGYFDPPSGYPFYGYWGGRPTFILGTHV